MCAAGTIACCMVYGFSGIAFLTAEDEMHFWMAVAGAIMMGALDITMMLMSNKNSLTPDVCIYTLAIVSDALYRGPETPYASIFVVAFAIRAWHKSFVLFFYPKQGGTMSILHMGVAHVDLVYSVVFMCLTAEVGLVPQFYDREDWPIYAGVGAFMTFLAAWSTRSPAAA